MAPTTKASKTNRTSTAPRTSIFAKKAVSLPGRWERTVFKVPQPYSLPTTSAPRKGQRTPGAGDVREHVGDQGLGIQLRDQLLGGGVVLGLHLGWDVLGRLGLGEVGEERVGEGVGQQDYEDQPDRRDHPHGRALVQLEKLGREACAH
jgi:hypothetical protein